MASVRKYATAKGHAWRVQYRSPDGRSRTKQGFRTKSEALAWAESNSVSARAGEWIDPNAGKVTVGTLGESWLATRTHLKPSTRRVVEQHWRNYVRPRWGETPVAAVKHSEVQAWVSGIEKSATIVRGAHNALSQILDLAVADGMIRKNPAQGCKLPRKGAPRKVYLTMPQLLELAAECSVRGELVLLLGTSGLRWGEAVALRPMDLDPLRGRISIERNAVTVGSEVVFGSPKTHERRTVAVAGYVMQLLLKASENIPRDELIWARAGGQPLRVPGHGSWFHGAVERVIERNRAAIAQAHADGAPVPGVFPRVTPHGLRHVAAGLLVEAGANVKAVQRQLGHASAAMTLDTYAELFDDGLDSIAAKLDESFSDVVELSWNAAKK